MPFLELQAGANAQQLCAEASVRRKAGTTEKPKSDLAYSVCNLATGQRLACRPT